MRPLILSLTLLAIAGLPLAAADGPTPKPKPAASADDEDEKPAPKPGGGATASGGGQNTQRAPVFEDVSSVTRNFIDPDLLPDTPNPITLFGDGFWEPGTLQNGRITPTLIVYGDLRSAYSYIEKPDAGSDTDVATARSRLTLEADLKLTATERFHARFVPISHGDQDTRVDFRPEFQETFEHSLKPQTLFFEGELDSIISDFGGSAQHDGTDLNYAIAAGKFPLELNNGYLVSDIFTGVGVTKNNISVPWASDLGVGVIYAFHDVDANAGTGKPAAGDAFSLLGLHGFADAADLRIETSLLMLDVQNADEVVGGRDRRQYYGAVSFAWLRGPVGQGLHLLGKMGDPDVTGNGALVVYESNVRLTPVYVDGGAYAMLNAFFGSPHWNSISGNLNQVGTTFQTDNLTGFPNQRGDGRDEAGVALAVQIKTLRRRLHFIPEVSYVDDRSDANNDTTALGMRINYGFGDRYVLRMDLRHFIPKVGESFNAGRAEFQIKF
jgi:hypothetical protein